MDRYFPLCRSGLVTDVYWQSGRKAGVAIAFALETELARAVLSRAESDGWERVSIEPDAAPAGMVDLVPPDVRREWQTSDRRRTVWWMMAASLAVLVLVVLATAGIRRSIRRVALSETEVAAETRSVALQREIARLRRLDSLFREDRAVNARTARLLGAIGVGLPDSAQLMSVALVNGTLVRLALTAASPDELLVALRREGENIAPSDQAPSLVRRGQQIWMQVVFEGRNLKEIR